MSQSLVPEEVFLFPWISCASSMKGNITWAQDYDPHYKEVIETLTACPSFSLITTISFAWTG